MAADNSLMPFEHYVNHVMFNWQSARQVYDSSSNMWMIMSDDPQLNAFAVVLGVDYLLYDAWRTAAGYPITYQA